MVYHQENVDHTRTWDADLVASGLSDETQAMFLCPSRAEVVLPTRLARKLALRSEGLANIPAGRIVGAFSGSIDIDGERISEKSLNLNGTVHTPADAKRARLLVIDGANLKQAMTILT